ncbi:MAG: DUF6456 domain-containing protein [Variibacter sp.]
MNARVRKTPAAGEDGGTLDPLRAQHLALGTRELVAPEGRRTVTVDESESPLAWLARRKGRSGEPLISATQLLAGERLRADFTRAQMTPRVTSQWDAALAQNRRSGGSFGLSASDATVAARQRVRHALDAVGPEFAGLLLDVCCFLKRLEEAERDRAWPLRSAKIVLQLGLDRLARHYGLAQAAHGPRRSAVRTWLAPDAAFGVGDFSAPIES